MKRRLFLIASIGAAGMISLGLVAGCTTSGLCPCSDARRPNVIPDEQLRNNPRLAEGQRIFMDHCNQCHVGGAAGLGPSLNDKRLPNWFMRVQVRRGLGAMPAYSPETISDGQLDDVVSYIRYLRQHPDGAGQG
jgi:mono/diheme cytochrome c family protein